MNNEKQQHMLRVTGDDLPAVFRAADQGSVAAQHRYLWLVKFDLSLMVLGAIVISLPLGTGQVKIFATIAGALILGISLTLTLAIKIVAYDELWYGGRAIAESAKTLAWRYMVCAEPYLRECALEDVDRQFILHLELVLRARKHLGAALGGSASSGEQITHRMRDVRQSDIETRKRTYLQDRVTEQRDWYGKRAEANNRAATMWIIAVASSKILAIASAILLVRWPGSGVNIAPVFVALGAALMAWSQVKRHQELAQSYALAAHELGFILAKEDHIKTDKELSDFVLDTENAISREHILWIARRDRDIVW